MDEITYQCESPDCTHPEDPADRDTNGTLDIMYVHTDCGLELLMVKFDELTDQLDSVALTLESFRR